MRSQSADSRRRRGGQIAMFPELTTPALRATPPLRGGEYRLQSVAIWPIPPRSSSSRARLPESGEQPSENLPNAAPQDSKGAREEVERLGGRALVVPADVSIYEQVESA